MSNIKIVTLFVVAVQISKKNESKKNKKIMKKILNKQIKKKKLCRIQNRYELKNKNQFQQKTFRKNLNIM